MENAVQALRDLQLKASDQLHRGAVKTRNNVANRRCNSTETTWSTWRGVRSHVIYQLAASVDVPLCASCEVGPGSWLQHWRWNGGQILAVTCSAEISAASAS